MNLGLKFEKQDDNGNWVGVLHTDNAVPVSNLAQCLFKDIDIRMNQVKICNLELFDSL